MNRSTSLLARVLLAFLGLHLVFCSMVCGISMRIYSVYIVLEKIQLQSVSLFYFNIHAFSLCILVRELQEDDVHFKTHTNEKRVNKKENIVSFNVPKHNDVDRSEILNEFNLVNKYTNVAQTQILHVYNYIQQHERFSCITAGQNIYLSNLYCAMIFYRT